MIANGQHGAMHPSYLIDKASIARMRDGVNDGRRAGGQPAHDGRMVDVLASSRKPALARLGTDLSATCGIMGWA